MRKLLRFLSVAVLVATANRSLSDETQRFIGAGEAQCIYSNADQYLARSLIIIVVDRCPEAGSALDGYLNDATSELPDTESMAQIAPRRPNVLYFSRRAFSCLVEYWQTQPTHLSEFLIPEDPCE